MEETEMTGNMNLNDAIIYLLNCKCAKERRSTHRYQCKKAGLNCTDLCSCSDSRELCMTTTIYAWQRGDDDEGYYDDDDDEDNDDGNDDNDEDEEEDCYD